MGYLETTLTPYSEYLPYFVVSVLIALLLTPLIGFLAKKLHIVDVPRKLRKITDQTRKTRIHKNITPRAGGLAFTLSFLIMLAVGQPVNKQIFAIILGIIILTISGLIDDKYQLNSKLQLLSQICAVLIVIAAGISIDSIQSPFDTSFNLRLLELPFTISATTYSIALPADIITIMWLLLMINAVNWIFGVDGLGEGISFIAFLTILLVSIKFSSPISALLATIAAGSMLGFLPYNLHPAKIFSGTAGTSVYGFLIGVLSILGGVKVSTSVIVLMIPLVDMVWVIVGRINRYGVTNLFDVFKVTSIGDDTHLHHRLLKLGLSQRSVALIEWTGVSLCATVAFFASSLPKATTISIIGAIVLGSFLLLSYFIKNGINFKRPKKILSSAKSKKSAKTPDDTPEGRYAY